MRILSLENNRFVLKDELDEITGVLIYENKELQKGEIRTTKIVTLEKIATGLWQSFSFTKGKRKQEAEIKVMPGGIIILLFTPRKVYRFRRTGAWKTRFVILNKDGEEVLALLPIINWDKKTYEFTLQVNDECKNECTPVLILHTVHCAVCSLNMINGGYVAPLVSV